MRSILRVTAIAALLAHVGPSISWAGKDNTAGTIVQQHTDAGGDRSELIAKLEEALSCLLYTSPSPRD